MKEGLSGFYGFVLTPLEMFDIIGYYEKVGNRRWEAGGTNRRRKLSLTGLTGYNYMVYYELTI